MRVDHRTALMTFRALIVFVLLGENRALSSHLGTGERAGQLGLVPCEQNPQRTSKQKKVLSRGDIMADYRESLGWH